MKKNSHIALLVCLMTLVGFGAGAQEALETGREYRFESPASAGEAESENKSAKFAAPVPAREVVRDSVPAVKPPPRKSESRPAQQTEDILSFNFLYYIIQRFKFSDIIE
jgi:hypothetical protein